MENYESIASLSCAGCLNDIGNDDYVTALGQDWHKECFRCSVCDSLLSTWYFEKNGLLFCQDDYWTRYGKCCQQCTQVITGPVMTAGEHRFHPECFACSLCGANIEDGEPYALLERSKLFCGACYDTGVSSSEKGTHSIRVQDVPAAAIDTAPIDNKLMVTRINTACGLLSLHIGDRILEINGSPVKSSSVERAEKMLASSDAVLQLTIEHNPATTNNNIPTKTSIPQNPPTNRSELKDCPTNQRGELNEGSTNQIVALKNRSPNRVALKDYTTQNIPEHSAEGKEGKRERLFKRKGEGEGKGRVMKRRQTPSSPLFGHKEKSSSMSELLDVVDGEEQNGGVLGELSRARSFRGEPPGPGQKVFLPCDLLQGELLGSGFFGQVYKVTHRATNEVMVLKQLYRVDEDAQRNFIKEVAVLRSLTHPNVLRFVGVLYRDKRLHLITEYVAGGTLYQLIQDTATPLSWVERARLARDVASGVGYLHRRDVIHRDLNSHNCLVREDKTVIVADFGLARIVQRAGAGTLERRRSAHSTLRRKRYTVVGNPYWMAPEMMNGNVYDEKVDIFSFGIILCEIIGRVSADPDFLPRRSDFGLNEPAFIESFCGDSPEPFYRIAFLACDLDPDRRPSFEVMEEWLERLIIHLSHASPMLRGLLQEVTSYGAADCCEKQDQVLKSSSNAAMLERCSLASGAGRALGKCVSASHIGGGRRTVTVTNLSRSQQSLATAPQGFILRADGCSINLTRVDDITQWIDAPRPLKRAHADGMLNQEPDTRKVEDVPAFFRNQSVEGLETDSKREGDVNNLCRHLSIPDRSVDSDSSDDDLNDSDWYKNVSSFRKLDKIDAEQKSATKIMKEDPGNVVLRNPNERKIPEEDSRRYNIDHLQKTRGMAEGIRNIAKAFEPKPPEKTNFFTKTLLSPKLSRLFKSSEVVRNKPQTDDKSKSKFFVQTPPPIGRSTYRVRPFDETDKHTEFQNRKNLRDNVIKNDLKLASLGKPMTPVFRRHNPKETPAFGDGRFSYRDRKCIYANADSKFVDVGRNRIKAPVSDVKSTAANKRTIQAALPAVEEKCKVEVADSKVGPKKREMAISRSNYVSLANLKINTRSKDTAKGLNSRDPLEENCPVERVI